ncbi:MAG: conserved repeat domain [Candidatus Ozemobacter sibiricus]|uniref:Conserved repeat domain n=1 Tax=Candidatus Ozemobacter sibiricus TaxID=2268124 RepID=A0A367ZPZ3_9BACT|nr:MAG: conserved repeat domain [Candidatus Ozemobacter sibiricus]
MPTGVLVGQVSSVPVATALRAQVVSPPYEVGLYAYGINHDLEPVLIDGVATRTTDTAGEFRFENVPGNLDNLILAARVGDQVFEGFVPFVDTTPGTTTQALTIDPTTASLTRLIHAGARARRTLGISREIQFDLGEVLARLSPSALAALTPAELTVVAEAFTRREKAWREGAAVAGLDSAIAEFRAKTRQALRRLIVQINQDRSRLSRDEVWKGYGNAVRQEAAARTPDLLQIYDDVNQQFLSSASTALYQVLPIAVRQELERTVEQERVLTQVTAFSSAIRTLAEGVSGFGDVLAGLEYALRRTEIEVREAPTAEAAAKAFSGNLTDQILQSAIWDLLKALGLYNESAGPATALRGRAVLGQIPPPGGTTPPSTQPPTPPDATTPPSTQPPTPPDATTPPSTQPPTPPDVTTPPSTQPPSPPAPPTGGTPPAPPSGQPPTPTGGGQPAEPPLLFRLLPTQADFAALGWPYGPGNPPPTLELRRETRLRARAIISRKVRELAATHAAFGARFNTEARQSALVLLLAGAQDIGLTLPTPPTSGTTGTGGGTPVSLTSTSTMIGMVVATASRTIGGKVYAFAIVPAPDSPAAPATWGCLALARGEGITLTATAAKVLLTVRVETGPTGTSPPAVAVTAIGAAPAAPQGPGGTGPTGGTTGPGGLTYGPTTDFQGVFKKSSTGAIVYNNGILDTPVFTDDQATLERFVGWSVTFRGSYVYENTQLKGVRVTASSIAIRSSDHFTPGPTAFDGTTRTFGFKVVPPSGNITSLPPLTILTPTDEIRLDKTDTGYLSANESGMVIGNGFYLLVAATDDDEPYLLSLIDTQSPRDPSQYYLTATTTARALVLVDPTFTRQTRTVFANLLKAYAAHPKRAELEAAVADALLTKPSRPFGRENTALHALISEICQDLANGSGVIASQRRMMASVQASLGQVEPPWLEVYDADTGMTGHASREIKAINRSFCHYDVKVEADGQVVRTPLNLPTWRLPKRVLLDYKIWPPKIELLTLAEILIDPQKDTAPIVLTFEQNLALSVFESVMRLIIDAIGLATPDAENIEKAWKLVGKLPGPVLNFLNNLNSLQPNTKEEVETFLKNTLWDASNEILSALWDLYQEVIGTQIKRRWVLTTARIYFSKAWAWGKAALDIVDLAAVLYSGWKAPKIFVEKGRIIEKSFSNRPACTGFTNHDFAKVFSVPCSYTFEIAGFHLGNTANDLTLELGKVQATILEYRKEPSPYAYGAAITRIKAVFPRGGDPSDNGSFTVRISDPAYRIATQTISTSAYLIPRVFGMDPFVGGGGSDLQTLTLYGDAFGSSQDGGYVEFWQVGEGQEVSVKVQTVNSWSNQQITLPLPAGLIKEKEYIVTVFSKWHPEYRNGGYVYYPLDSSAARIGEPGYHSYLFRVMNPRSEHLGSILRGRTATVVGYHRTFSMSTGKGPDPIIKLDGVPLAITRTLFDDYGKSFTTVAIPADSPVGRRSLTVSYHGLTDSYTLDIME